MKKSPLERALERIEECRRTHAEELALIGLGLDHIPPQVAELTWLKEFNCDFNKINDLSPLASLKNLQVIDCYVSSPA